MMTQFLFTRGRMGAQDQAIAIQLSFQANSPPLPNNSEELCNYCTGLRVSVHCIAWLTRVTKALGTVSGFQQRDPGLLVLFFRITIYCITQLLRASIVVDVFLCCPHIFFQI